MKRVSVLSIFILFALVGFVYYKQNPGMDISHLFSVTIPCSKKPIPQRIEGPYYKSGSPERQTVRKDNTQKIPMTLEGYVLDINCKPIAHAWIDFWQADGAGKYDNAGYLLRGHQYTDENGKYKLVTVVPGIYPGRTEHIHVKIKATDKSPIITTQLFLPNGSSNETDTYYDKALVISLKDAPQGAGKEATYNFVVEK